MPPAPKMLARFTGSGSRRPASGRSPEALDPHERRAALNTAPSSAPPLSHGILFVSPSKSPHARRLPRLHD